MGPPLLPLALLCAPLSMRGKGGGATFLQPRRGYTTYAGGQNGVGEGKKIVLTPPLQSIFLSFLGPFGAPP